MLLTIELFIVGLGVGSFGTLIGVGGGFILVPVFLLLFDYTPQFAVGTSLAVVFFNAFSRTIAYMRGVIVNLCSRNKRKLISPYKLISLF